MAGIHKEDAWLINSVAYKILSIGEDPIAFAIKLKELRGKNLDQFTRLFGICERLEFVEQLRHTLNLMVAREKEGDAVYQLERLVTYLTTTCVDITIKEGFEDYKTWLSRAYKSGELDELDIWNTTIKQFSTATNEQEIGKLFVKATQAIHDKYYGPNMSIRKGFRRFIESMDAGLQGWLFKNFIIELSDSDRQFDEKFIEPRWETSDSGEKCQRIAFYLYDLRNLYTHTVDYFQPMNLNQRGFSGNSRRNFYYTVSYGDYMSTVFPPSPSVPHYRFVLLPQAHYESDVIRLLIVAWLRKNWLDIQDDENLLQDYWDRTEYRRLGFIFLSELEKNHRLIERWCSYPLSPLYHELERIDFRLPTLDNTFAKQFIEKHQEISSSSISLCNTDSYLALIEKINSKLLEYNARHANLDLNTRANEVRKLLPEIVQLPETGHLYNCIQHFTRDLFRRLDIPYYYRAKNVA